MCEFQRVDGADKSKMMQSFNPVLTEAEVMLTRCFMMMLRDDKKEYWCTDDFRGYGLDKELADPQHELGGLCAKWRWNGISRQAGEVPSEIASNNKRKVDLNFWDWSAWRRYLKEHL